MNLSELAGRLQGISQKLINAYNLNHSMQMRVDELEAQNADLQNQITQLQSVQNDPALPSDAEQELNNLDQSAESFVSAQEQAQEAVAVVPPEAVQAVDAIAETAQALEADAQQSAQPEQPAA